MLGCGAKGREERGWIVVVDRLYFTLQKCCGAGKVGGRKLCV